MTSSSEQPKNEPFATKMKTDDSHVCYPNCVKFETKRCPYPGTSVRRDTCNCFRSNEDDHYIQSLIFGVYNYPNEIERIVKEHDATIARKAREDVLKEFSELFEQIGNLHYLQGNKIVASAYYGAMTYTKRGQFPESEKEHLEETENVKKKIESLRTTPHTEQEQP